MTRYADDFVILLYQKEEKKFIEFLEFLEKDLKLKVNREKTKTETLKEGVNFLGFTMREKISKRKKKYLSVEPSKESMKRIKDKIRNIIKRQTTESTDSIIKRANRTLNGWQQYFDNICIGKARQKIRRYAETKLARVITARNNKRGINWKIYEKDQKKRDVKLTEMKNLKRIFT